MAAGDITYDAGGSKLAFGSVAADADTAIEVLCGFQPDEIELIYKDTGAVTVDQVILWRKGMTAAEYFKTLMSTGVITLVTSGGPAVLAASETNITGEGFTIPAGLQDADSDMIYWKASKA